MNFHIPNFLAPPHDKSDDSDGVCSKCAEKAAVASSHLKAELLATLSHEIRTPMNAVLGMTDLLGLTDLTRKQQTYLQTIQSSGDMLLSLLENSLDYSRLAGGGGIELRQQEFELGALIERVLQIMGYQAYSKGLELIADFPLARPVRVSGDSDRLRQILVNLVSNAVRYSEKGVIVLSATVEDSAEGALLLKFAVTDQGEGMAEELQKRLATPFESLHIHATDSRYGSGLGLNICKRLLENMGGNIDVTSERGVGTTICFEVPVKSVTEKVADTEPNDDRLDKQCALIINSNPAITEIICHYFQDWGLECKMAVDVEMALKMLELDAIGKCTVSVIDKDLAGHDGLLLARQIRARRSTAGLPIILLTSIANPLEVGEISMLGNIRCINKPVLPSELHHSLLRLTHSDTEFAADTIVLDDSNEVGLIPQQQLRVLIAEDNAVNSRMLRTMLCSLDCYPDIVESGPAALQTLEREAYDLVLMDCQMPGLDGEEVTRQLRANPDQYASQPVVIAVTADNSDQHRLRCLDAGMDGFIAKPIRLEKLVSGLQQWPLLLGRQRAHDTGQVMASQADDDIQAQVHSQLSERVGSSGIEFLHEYIDLFLSDTATRLARMRKAVAAGNTSELSRESHALKGTCLEFGVLRMGQYCDSLRVASEQADLPEAARFLGLLDAEFARVGPVFEAEKAAGGSQPTR